MKSTHTKGYVISTPRVVELTGRNKNAAADALTAANGTIVNIEKNIEKLPVWL